MSIALHFITLLVRKDAVERQYPNGIVGFEARYGSWGSFRRDAHLLAVGFMSGAECRDLVDELEEQGLVYVSDGKAQDMIVVSVFGPACKCDWIEVGPHDCGFPQAWLASHDPGEIVLLPYMKKNLRS